MEEEDDVDQADEIELDDEFTCWCGAVGRYEDLCDEDGLEGTCGGLGTLNCYCGGDFCVCHHHGEVECDGCPDCESEDFDAGHDYEPDPDDEP